MLFQTDYCFRRTSGVNPHIEHRKDVVDPEFTRHIRLNGPHQLFIDCSRCTMVSPQLFDQLGICKNLQYLDVSYTAIKDISAIAENCVDLRSLNLAGLTVESQARWEPLKIMTTLEVLSLRSSSCVTNASVAPMEHFLQLRSLNLGYTEVTDVSFSLSLTRLEELVLDGTRAGDGDDHGHGHGHGHGQLISSNSNSDSHDDAVPVAGKTFSAFAEIVAALPSLTVLNICDTPIDTPLARAALYEALPPRVYLEADNRQLLFFQSVIDGDTESVRRLVSEGVDVDDTIGLDAGPLLLHAWKDRCNFTAQRHLMTPFFQIMHPEPKLRPRAVHLAILFNSAQILADFVSIGASLTGQVWFGDMKEDGTHESGFGIDHESLEDFEEKKLRDEEKEYMHNGEDTRSDEQKRAAARRRPHIYTLKELSEMMLYRNCHRLTMDMVRTKVPDWKLKCQRYSEDLVAILENRYQSQMAMRALEREREEAERDAQEAAREQRRLERVGGNKKKNSEEDGEEDEEGKGKGEEEEEEKNTGKEEEKEGVRITPQEEEEAEELLIGPIKWKKPGRQPLKLMGPRNHAMDYRKHGLYAKLNGPAYSLPSDVTGREKDIFWLGKRDYWMESRAFTLERNLAVQLANEKELAQRRKEDKVFEMSYRRKQRIFGRKDYKQGPGEPERQEMFKDNLQKTIARKFIVREDNEDEDDDDEDEELDARSQMTLDSEEASQINIHTGTATAGPVGAINDEAAQTSIEESDLEGLGLLGSPQPQPQQQQQQQQEDVSGTGKDEHVSESLAMQLAAAGAFDAAEKVLTTHENHAHHNLVKQGIDPEKAAMQHQEEKKAADTKHHLHLKVHRVDGQDN